MGKLDLALQDRLKLLLKTMGYELVGCELASQGRGSTFRLYIDRPGGVTSQDCALVSHQVSAMMDVADPIHGRYTLEVSSPGIDRPLFTLEQYQQFIGHQVKVKLRAPVDSRRQYQGTLTRIDGEKIFLLVAKQEIAFTFQDIEKANLVGEIHF